MLQYRTPLRESTSGAVSKENRWPDCAGLTEAMTLFGSMLQNILLREGCRTLQAEVVGCQARDYGRAIGGLVGLGNHRRLVEYLAEYYFVISY
jgi:hypothetical protein